MILYKHINNTDVAMRRVYTTYKRSEAGYEVKCEWWNIVNPKNIYYIGIKETVFIKDVDWKNWKPMGEKNDL